MSWEVSRVVTTIEKRRWHVFLVILLCLMIPSSYEVKAQTKRALVIGLGQQKDPSWGKIHGDIDIIYIFKMLKSVGYNANNIYTLKNEQATKNGIVHAFKELTNSCQNGDIVYIHFSGHGQRVTDLNGDEDDGWDESWIPYDAYKENCDLDTGEKHLIDDEIYILLTAIKHKIGEHGKLLVVIDACHSGDSTRASGYAIRGVGNKFILPGKYNIKIKKPAERWIALSACKFTQYNQEMNLPQVGILSYALYSISKKGHVNMEAIEAFIKKHKGPYPQTPILTGEIDKYNISDVLK